MTDTKFDTPFLRVLRECFYKTLFPHDKLPYRSKFKTVFENWNRHNGLQRTWNPNALTKCTLPTSSDRSHKKRVLLPFCKFRVRRFLN